ncbi:MAG: hypothetical protein K2N38_09455 [Oscillospiraceae bacterium]|nr:hypothetical protein [Oscillospiraceae bacterium]
MKYTLENFFEDLNPNELDEIMPDNFDEKLQKNILKRIEKTTLCKSGIKNNSRRFNFKIFAPVAACLVLTAGLGGCAIAAEVKEYNAAVDFFEQNGLSVEGLSREELKEVYRDITTNRFTNDKTAEVIRRSVPGVEILQHEPTPEELSVLWNSNVNAWSGSHTKAAVKYQIDYEYQPGAQYYEFDKITVECLRDGETLWKTDFPTLGKKWGDDELYINDCVMTSVGTVVWGHRCHWTEVTEGGSKANPLTYGRIARIDDSGCKLWERELDHGFKDEYIKAVLDNGDGTLAVISYGDFEYLCLSQYDADGNELSFTKTQFSRIGNILNAAKLGDGYLVQLAGTDEDDGRAHLAKLDRAGNVTDNFVYKSEECDYYITDMAEFEGNVYLSAYSVPKQTGEGWRNEIADIQDYLFNRDNWDISSEELTPIVRDNYTAVLLLCDPAGGEPKNFYSVKGSLGGALAVENDQLKWNVESIASTFFSPATSAFSIGGNCLVYRYSFDESGTLAGCEDTGEIAHYAR